VPRMPKYAKIQNARNRISPRSPVTFFNSPFGLWLLSAIFLTVGGAALSSRQECLASARSDIESFRRLSEELVGRRVRLMLALQESSTAIDFQKALRSDAYASYKEFDGQNLRTLIDRQQVIAVRFDLSKQTTDSYIKLLAPEDPPGNPPGKIFDFILRFGNLPGTIVSDDDVKEPRQNIALRLNRYFSIAGIEGALQLEPACSFWRLATRVIFEDYKTIVEVPRPDVVFPPTGDHASGQPPR
jgi:hypothetical protein